MKKHLFHLFVAFIATMGFSSCEETDVLGTFTGYDDAALKQECSSDASSTLSFTFTSDCDWAAVVDTDTAEATDTKNHWLTLDKASGAKGESTITFALTENGTGAERAANVKITCGTEGTLIVNVKQKAEEKIFSGYEASTLIQAGDAEGGLLEVPFTFTSTTAWTVSSESEWVSFRDFDADPLVDEGGVAGEDIILQFRLTENKTAAERVAIVIIKGTSGNDKIEITITQASDLEALKNFTGYDDTKLAQDVKGDAVTLDEFVFNSKSGWSVASDSEAWATVEITSGKVGDGTPEYPTTGNSGEGKIAITLTENDTDAVRIAKIKINTLGTDGGDALEIVITQAVAVPVVKNFTGYTAALLAQSVTGDAATLDAFTFTSAGAWTVSSDKAWATLNVEGGTATDGSIAITLLENDTDAVRIATITLVSTVNPDEKLLIVITQAVAVVSVKNFTAYDEERLTASVDEGTTTLEAFTFTSAAAWTVKCDNYVEIVPLPGGDPIVGGDAGINSIDIRVKTNWGDEPKILKVTLSSGEGDAKQDLVITINQAATPPDYFADYLAPRVFPTSAAQDLAAITFTAGGAWTASIDENSRDWASIDVESGIAGAQSIVITLKENPGEDDRRATLAIKSTTTDDYENYYFTQQGKPAVVPDPEPGENGFNSHDELEVSLVNGFKAYTFDSKGPWTAVVGTVKMTGGGGTPPGGGGTPPGGGGTNPTRPWLSVSKNAGSAGPNTINLRGGNFFATPGTTRTEKVTITSGGVDIVLNVTQTAGS